MASARLTSGYRCNRLKLLNSPRPESDAAAVSIAKTQIFPQNRIFFLDRQLIRISNTI
jgi:hypothetical protein